MSGQCILNGLRLFVFDLKGRCDGRWGHLLSGTGLNSADKHIPATSAMPTGLWQEPIGSFLSVWRLIAVWTGGPPDLPARLQRS